MRLWHSILLAWLTVPAWSGLPPAATLRRDVPFFARPVALFPREPARRTLGALDYLRGYCLVSADPEFGGFSSILTDGHHFTLLNDGSEGIAFTLGADGSLDATRIFSLPAAPGPRWEKSFRDSESMTRDPNTGELWVGFETTNVVRRYAPGFARLEAQAAPPAMATWAENLGAESMVRLRDGRFLVIGEGAGTAGDTLARPMLIFTGDPTHRPQSVVRLHYLPPPGFSPTDAAELPDGRILIVNRHFALGTGFTAALTLVPREAIQPGATITGREIARFATPAQHDNFEGVAAIQAADGLHLWIVADDNQNWFEQSLLLEFRLDERRLAAMAPVPPPRPIRPRASTSSSLHASAGARATKADRPRS